MSHTLLVDLIVPLSMNGIPSSLESDLHRSVQCASRFYDQSNPENTAKFDESLVALIKAVSSVDPAARLNLSIPSLVELLNYVPIFLTASTTSASTRSKLLRFLFNIGQFNVPLRRHLASDIQLCGPVFECLKLSLKEQLGPQNLIDILRLLQVLTYEKCFTVGLWTNELVSFLLKELSREEEQEWLPYSIAILCNLASRSKSISLRIRKSSSYREFARRLTKLLQHDSRIVVVSSLVLIGYLEEKLRELVYCPQNIVQTFQCVFNVLILGDTLMTRHIAADLLKRLVVSETPSVSSTPTLSSSGKDLMNYSYFTRCLQETAALLVSQDARMEESTKIYDVLLAFCSVPSMRSTVALGVLDTPPTEQRLTTPLVAIARTARMSFDEAIEPSVPLKALQLLNYLLKEAVEANRRLIDLIPEERLLSIIDSAVKTPIHTSHPQVVSQCKRICEGIRLAEAITAGDHSLRVALLDVLSSSLCSHIMETQLLSNPVVLYMGKAPALRSTEGLPDWSIEGVGIVLEMLRLLAAFKDYSKPHKDQYWKSIKDDRLLPFLAFSISRGSPSMVHDALILYTHCAQNQAFSSQGLADLVASCSRESTGSVSRAESVNGRGDKGRRSDEKDDDRKRLRLSEDAVDDEGGRGRDQKSNGVNMNQLDELIGALRNGLDLKNPKTSDLLSAYENKLAMQQIRERELERLVATKDAALQQSERLRIQYAASGSRGSDTDLARIRSLVADVEQLKEEKEKVEERMDMKKKEMEEATKMIEMIKSELSDLQKEKCLLLKDIEKERELSTTLRKNIDEFKAKMEKMSKAVLQLQEQLSVVTSELEAKKDEIFKMNEERKALDKTLEEVRRDRDMFKTKYEDMERNAEKSKAELEERKRKMREEMMRLAGEF